ncbi:hypothetical protein COT97_05030 [Candidatus Falkowbacteria bacterium CG10_big_fil_rev_8_21_14_0_10_39_11]|uniref:Uncharacterized protein n=1 Tax=Candidatus Falkowbacteria bacterium CG10_big_fil_rev_8_21_14_0_10_39_11 TaxID=1974565 RepID=A0A2H0V3S1_9BACT|nr:MAG: hypothetical protein COT97_05030 [Candidatus Falkowbacteria bacterium CG10_big_fil_rev_8_21_14_0_10_39_11]
MLLICHWVGGKFPFGGRNQGWLLDTLTGLELILTGIGILLLAAFLIWGTIAMGKAISQCFSKDTNRTAEN